MSRKLISSDSEFEAKIGYSRAVVDDDYVFVSGTTGYNYQEMSISENVIDQAEQCFRNIEIALKEAGSSIKDIVRVIYILLFISCQIKEILNRVGLYSQNGWGRFDLRRQCLKLGFSVKI